MYLLLYILFIFHCEHVENLLAFIEGHSLSTLSAGGGLNFGTESKREKDTHFFGNWIWRKKANCDREWKRGTKEFLLSITHIHNAHARTKMLVFNARKIPHLFITTVYIIFYTSSLESFHFPIFRRPTTTFLFHSFFGFCILLATVLFLHFFFFFVRP